MNVGNIPTKLQPRYRYKIHDKLYDLTDFVKVHPGGQDMFNNLKPDTNITPMIYAYHKNPIKCLAMLPKYEVSFTYDIIIKYDTNYTYGKYCELKKLVYDEIHEKKIPLYWSNKEIAYNVFMLSVYVGIWGYCLYYANNLSYLWMILLAVMNMGLGGLIYHEVSHYTGFKNQHMNNYIAFYMYPLAVDKWWKSKHNYLHHCFTNTEYDEDINYKRVNHILRHYSSAPLYYYHRFQIVYCSLLFTSATLLTLVIQSIKHKKLNILCVIYTYYILGPYHVALFYGLFSFLFIFIVQLSHIQHECIQINVGRKNDFLYNQVSSSMNYRTHNFITRFLCSGLDIQIEHHLFPNIPHSSLRQIQHIVRGYCDKNDIPYIEKPSILPTIYSYICYLYKMGNP